MTFLRAEHLPRRYRVGVFVVLLLASFSRAPYLLVHGRFFAEEGTMYFSHMKHGSVWFVARPVGYIYAFCNIATSLATHVPLERAPLVTAWLSLGVIALLIWARCRTAGWCRTGHPDDDGIGRGASQALRGRREDGLDLV